MILIYISGKRFRVYARNAPNFDNIESKNKTNLFTRAASPSFFSVGTKYWILKKKYFL